jgi:hypothetical protein
MRDLLHAVLHDPRTRNQSTADAPSLNGPGLNSLHINSKNHLLAAGGALALSPSMMVGASPLSNITQQPPLQPPVSEQQSGTEAGKKKPARKKPAQPRPRKPKKAVTAAADTVSVVSATSSTAAARPPTKKQKQQQQQQQPQTLLAQDSLLFPTSGISGETLDPRDLF